MHTQETPVPIDTASAAELRELFDYEDDEPLQDVIGTCSGEWRRGAGDLWHFHDMTGDE